jgi:hypothetical protein
MSEPASTATTASTPATQDEAAANDGFVVYDQLTGPDLDPALWETVRLPLPTGGEHPLVDPRRQPSPAHRRATHQQCLRLPRPVVGPRASLLSLAREL